MKFISNHIASCIRCAIYHRLSTEGEEAGLGVGGDGGRGAGGGILADAPTDMYNNCRLDSTRTPRCHDALGAMKCINTGDLD